ncbi:hypothetical protein Achl_4388 (plasmid) [Pseudarthrobacter chlorophenolicus A6]|uniref:Uncharacterized protein n=1 Tax=Pseudarthrobacter chlorophenolicus (strain ATCC 700700 / DSM 12829 / CIP 107037 / JCM 12360 / KCTC 9906 / NCIMB 13794 / A6) TaxID=452863 RepID=B8HIU2_PSECP|nr:hypothetical protein [Pseudarthrobacter chlorophenolicus]ACL42339.1 hypothetical protein Achl_4388 [Pseudarthrobacter chlorophenolicus A6]SDQ16715.1 hypothetical protein SAMN04489738_0445 [Pseudarthrobacter chlorophenolicus]
MGLKDRALEGHRFRRQVIAQMGKPGGPAVERLYGKGTLVQHYALDRLSPKALCGGSVMLVSEQPFTTSARLQCPLCVSVVARVMVRIAAEQAATRK